MNKTTTTTTKTTLTLTNGTVFNPVFIVVIVIIIIIKNTVLCSSLVADRKRRQGSPAELSIVFQFKGNISSKAMKQINISTKKILCVILMVAAHLQRQSLSTPSKPNLKMKVETGIPKEN